MKLTASEYIALENKIRKIYGSYDHLHRTDEDEILPEIMEVIEEAIDHDSSGNN